MLTTIYVGTKSGLTEKMNRYSSNGYKTYRVRTECECKCKTNRRNAVLCVNPDTLTIEVIVIKCKRCSELKSTEG